MSQLHGHLMQCSPMGFLPLKYVHTCSALGAHAVYHINHSYSKKNSPLSSQHSNKTTTPAKKREAGGNPQTASLVISPT